MTDMHTKNPWEDIKGVKHNSLREKSQQSLTDCIEFHKLAVFTVDAAERLRYYLMCCIKKPVRWTIRMHISRMEVLNKYLGGFSLPSRTAPWLSPPQRWATSIHGDYSCKYHLVTPPSCMEEPVRPDAQDSPGVASCDAPGPREYREALC